jgi:hypothetical protein
VKFLAPLPGSRRKHYQCIAIEDCTRLHVLRIYPQLNQGYRRIHGQLCHLGTRTGLRPAPCGPPCSALVLIQHLAIFGRRLLDVCVKFHAAWGRRARVA